jgi:hypothetical protein
MEFLSARRVMGKPDLIARVPHAHPISALHDAPDGGTRVVKRLTSKVKFWFALKLAFKAITPEFLLRRNACGKHPALSWP